MREDSKERDTEEKQIWHRVSFFVFNNHECERVLCFETKKEGKRFQKMHRKSLKYRFLAKGTSTHRRSHSDL